MTTRWTEIALRDLELLHAHVSGSGDAASVVVDRILSAMAALERHPEMGRSGRVPGTRELVVAPYIIHGARQWPDSF